MRTMILIAVLTMMPVTVYGQDPPVDPVPVEQPATAADESQPIPAIADDAQPDGGEVVIVPAPQLTSVLAVVVFAIFGTTLLRRAFAGVPVISAVPVWVYVVTLAFGLTYLANQVIGSLQGSFWDLAWQAVFNGAAASGVREWIHSGPTKPMAASGTGSARWGRGR